jgi:hypothetical protein
VAACALRIETVPVHASIFSEGEDLGESPAHIELPCGRQEIRIEHPRYVVAERELDLSPDHTARLRVELMRPRRSLRVTSKPAGAEVWIRGRRVGETPLEVKVVAYERVPIKIKKFGFRSIMRTLNSTMWDEQLSVALNPFWNLWDR